MRVLGYSQAQWDALTDKERKDLHFKAKSVSQYKVDRHVSETCR
jgi:hypothetical protein